MKSQNKDRLNPPLLLLILDGWGYSTERNYNAIALANTPVWDTLWGSCPHTLLSCSGLDVGLPDGQMGNSEVGHTTIGAGRVCYQDLTKINMAIKNGDFANNSCLVKQIIKARDADKSFHLLGLLSDGGVHSHEEHFYAVLKLCGQLNMQKVYIHAILDGRDTPPKSAIYHLQKLQEQCLLLNTGSIKSIVGRFYAMDRDQRDERTKLAFDMLLCGHAAYSASDYISALEQAYSRGETDEFVGPTIIGDPKNIISADDHVLFMNFRADRARQLCYKLKEHVELITMTEYASDLSANVVFPKEHLFNTIGECIAKHNLSQLRIAETEKYAHITFFLNGGKEQALIGEKRILVPSPKVSTYDLQPEMSVHSITDYLVESIKNCNYDVIICNFANADMVGHTGNLPATIAAIEAIDISLGRIIEALKFVSGEMLITADHGNAEIMFDIKSKQAHTAHTMSTVPLIYFGKRKIKFYTDRASLVDIAPSFLTLLGIEIPGEMTGKSLIMNYE